MSAKVMNTQMRIDRLLSLQMRDAVLYASLEVLSQCKPRSSPL